MRIEIQMNFFTRKKSRPDTNTTSSLIFCENGELWELWIWEGSFAKFCTHFVIQNYWRREDLYAVTNYSRILLWEEQDSCRSKWMTIRYKSNAVNISCPQSISINCKYWELIDQILLEAVQCTLRLHSSASTEGENVWQFNWTKINLTFVTIRLITSSPLPTPLPPLQQHTCDRLSQMLVLIPVMQQFNASRIKEQLIMKLEIFPK